MADVVDPHRLAVFRQQLRPDRLATIIDTYVSNGVTLMDALAAAFDGQDLDEVRRVAHTMGTSAGLLGARPLQQVLADLEAEAARGAWPPGEAFSQASDLFARSVKELRQVDTSLAKTADPATSFTR